MSGNSGYRIQNYSCPIGPNKQTAGATDSNRDREIAQLYFDAETNSYIQNSDSKGIENQLAKVTKKVPSGKPTYVVSPLSLMHGISSAKSLSASGREIEASAPLHKGVTAFAFDIDGVLIRSKAPLPGATETLRVLQQYRIPFIFLTNGGGRTEEGHASHLGQLLDLEFSGEQFVQSHTPFRALVPKLQNANILILGGVGTKNCDVARAYGFKNVLSSSDIFRMEPAIYPFAELTELNHLAHGRNLAYFPRTSDGSLKIDAIFVFSSPRDWGLDLQLVMDLLLSQNGILGTNSPKNGDSSLPNRGYQQDGQPGLYFCNPDLTWASNYPQPRMAQGAFASALEGIWASRTGGAELLNQYVCGKPTEITYNYAERVLLDYHSAQHNFIIPDELETPLITSVYMIGDNPTSDIAGANAFQSPTGIQWNSVLVESGVYESGTAPAHRPTAIAKGVKEAVEWALQKEGWPISRL
jgi:HAD superfamily hydrolase (TIGR01456 family)